MGRKRRYMISRCISLDRLEKMIKEKELEARILKRLYFIRWLYECNNIEKAVKKTKITKATGYAWLRRWNEKGYDGLLPNFRGGRPSKLHDVQKNDLTSVLTKRNRWTIVDVQDLIKKRYDVHYSSSQVRRLLTLFGMKSKNTYSRYYRY
ncbi:MAG: helix-turn-helix domain-containing protein [Thermoplasmata archaeon]